MLGDSLIEGQDPEIIHGIGTTLFMNMVTGELRCAGYMQPVNLALYPGPVSSKLTTGSLRICFLISCSKPARDS